ncbi:hypothetical protein CCACVL1_26253 [Corchorus capsularis]|uniref:Uncharacterized protein n=1 Tax=Corchorus capsularis TaxID=210143 RepID=A0A1R3GFF4_COCAP|nr:hypothetical protein CCACVL1_26253 [Corchorus capsularis]
MEELTRENVVTMKKEGNLEEKGDSKRKETWQYKNKPRREGGCNCVSQEKRHVEQKGLGKSKPQNNPTRDGGSTP